MRMMSTEANIARKAKRLNITIPAALHDDAVRYMERFRYTDLSSLIQHSLREEIYGRNLSKAEGEGAAVDAMIKIKALRALQDSLQLTPEKAAAWMATIRDARR
jgi:hypothetical protein